MNQLVVEDDEGFQPGDLLKNFEIAVAGDQSRVMVKALLCDQRVFASGFSQLGEVDGEGDFAFAPVAAVALASSSSGTSITDIPADG